MWHTYSNRTLRYYPLCHARTGCLDCRGLITRNALKSVEHFHAKLEAQPFKPSLDRAFVPYKPHPAAILHICQEWGLAPGQVAMVGDSAKDDVRSLLLSVKPLHGPASVRSVLGLNKRAGEHLIMESCLAQLPVCASAKKRAQSFAYP